MNVLITGASKGIGKAIALEMAKIGHNLALCARNKVELEILKQEILTLYNIKIFAMPCDCGVKQEVLNFTNLAQQALGNFNVLVNNVGVFKPSYILDEDDEILISQLNTNLLSAYYFYKIIGKTMRYNTFGHIFNICSVASLETLPQAGSYCVTKAAMLSLNNVMREELKEFGVKVTAILPGATYTPSWEGLGGIPQNFVQANDIAIALSNTLNMSANAYTEQIIIKSLLVKS